MKNIFSTAILCLAMSISTTAFAQKYHQSTGNGRGVSQSQNGLSPVPATQITDGTLSKSAQGDNRQRTGLPDTALGPSVRPGDRGRTDLPGQQRSSNASSTLPSARLGRIRPGDVSRSDLKPGKRLDSGLQQTNLGPHVRPGDKGRTDIPRPHLQVQSRSRPAAMARPTQPATATYDKPPSY